MLLDPLPHVCGSLPARGASRRHPGRVITVHEPSAQRAAYSDATTDLRGRRWSGLLWQHCARWLLFPAVAGAAFPQDGKRWRQVQDTTGVTAAQVAAVCPPDGASRCAGALRRLDLGHRRAGDRADGPLRAGDPDRRPAERLRRAGHLFTAMNFLDRHAPDVLLLGLPDDDRVRERLDRRRQRRRAPATSTRSSTAASGSARRPTSPRTAAARGSGGPATDDITAPVVRAVVNGTLGTQDWYRSDVSVSWEVSDPDSAVSFDCPPATVTADTAGTTFTCSATSGGGTTTVSTTVKRDTVAPVITCGTPAPAFTPNQVGGVPVTLDRRDLGPAQRRGEPARQHERARVVHRDRGRPSTAPATGRRKPCPYTRRHPAVQRQDAHDRRHRRSPTRSTARTAPT